MNLSICAPNKQFKNKKTCFSLNSLKKIATSYNKKVNSNNKIPISNDINVLHSNIKKKLSKVCTGEVCWANQSFVKELNDDEINYLTFKPVRPVGKNQWLSTTDIKKVMLQYEKKFTDFVFLGPVPIDFDDIQTEISNLSLQELKAKGINKIGIVFNLDEHYKSGSHWVALYMEFSNNKKEINYFDSYGDNPVKRIEVLMNRLIKNAKNELNISVTKNINRTRTQFAHSECGVYSMNFILHLLMGDSFRETTQNIINDEEMTNRRNLFFRSNSSLQTI